MRRTRATVATTTLLVGAAVAGCGDSSIGLPSNDEGGSAPFHKLGAVGDIDVLLDARDRFVNMVVGEADYARLLGVNGLSGTDARRFSRAFYHFFRSDFDFLMITVDPARPQTTGPFGQAFGVSNDTRGVGRGLFDTTLDFGDTEGRLQTFIYIRGHSNLRGGPSLHEILHRWSQFLFFTGSGAHWGATGVGGQHGGWAPGTLEELGDGRYQARGLNGRLHWGTVANGGNALPFAPVELYLMGLLPAEEVPSFIRAIDAQVDPSTPDAPRSFTAARLDTVTVEEIIAEFGPRIPAAGAAPTHFRMAYVVISAAPLEADQWDQISDDVRRFGRAGSDGDDERSLRLFNFWEATGGRATLGMEFLSSSVRLKPGSGS